MNVEKFPGDVWYYTDMVSDQEMKIILQSVDSVNDWVGVYDDGHRYDPYRDKSLNPYGSVMLASRKNFTINGPQQNIQYDPNYEMMADIMNRVLEEATEHYAKENNLKDYQRMHPFQSIDRHLIGTCYQTHCDTAPIGVDSRTVLIYVNDNYEGGELSFTLPKEGRKIIITSGVAADHSGAKVAYPPNHEENKDLVDYWIKPKAMSVVIFPPDGLPHSAHEVLGASKYMVKAYWQLSDTRVEQWTSNPYEGRTEEEIQRVNPEGFVIGDYQHQDILSGKQIVPDEYRTVEY